MPALSSGEPRVSLKVYEKGKGGKCGPAGSWDSEQRPRSRRLATLNEAR